MRSTKMAGVSRLVLHRRERAVLLLPRDEGIELWTLRYGEEVRSAREIYANVCETKPDPKLLALVSELIEKRKKPWSPDLVRDPVQERLIEMIEKKKTGARPARRKLEAAREGAPSNVINIMDALRRSVAKDPKKH